MFDRHDRRTTDEMESHVEDISAHRSGPEDAPGTGHIGPFTIWNPSAVQSDDSEVCLWPVTPAAITITKLTVTLDAAANEVAGDLKYADAFIGLANPVVINDFDTTNGVRVDDTIASGAVAAGKCIYLSFDSAPHADITQMSMDIEFTYD